MLVQQSPAFILPESAVSHALDPANLASVQSGTGAGADAFVLGIAGIWDAVRHMDKAFALIVKSGRRVGVAASHLVIEGRAGLNLGLLMPSLRRLDPVPTGHDLPRVQPFQDRYHRTVWDIALRLARVEVDRLFAFKIGKRIVRVQASRTGFSIIDGCKSLVEFLDILRAAAKAGTAVAYRLEDGPGPAGLPQTLVSDLFGPATPGQPPLEIAPDGWPKAVPAGTDLATLTILAATMQRMQQVDQCDELSFTVIDASSKLVLSGVRNATTVGLAFAPVGGSDE